MKQVLVVAALASAITGCASSPDKISPSYVSPLEYSNLDCDQIRAELIRVSSHVSEVAGVQHRAHTRDEWAMGVGLVVFWPALFFLMGGDRKEELARLKGQYDALDEIAIQKRCSVADEIRDANADEARRHGRRVDNAINDRDVAPPAPTTTASPAAAVRASSRAPSAPATNSDCKSVLSTPEDPSAVRRYC